MNQAVYVMNWGQTYAEHLSLHATCTLAAFSSSCDAIVDDAMEDDWVCTTLAARPGSVRDVTRHGICHIDHVV